MSIKKLVLIFTSLSLFGLVLTKAEVCIGGNRCADYTDFGQFVFVWGLVLLMSVLLMRIIFPHIDHSRWIKISGIYIFISLCVWYVTGEQGGALLSPDREGILFGSVVIYIFLFLLILFIRNFKRKKEFSERLE